MAHFLPFRKAKVLKPNDYRTLRCVLRHRKRYRFLAKGQFRWIFDCFQTVQSAIRYNLRESWIPATIVQRWQLMSGNYRRTLSLLFPEAVLLNNSLINSKGSILPPKQTLPRRPIASLQSVCGGKLLIFHCFQHVTDITPLISHLQNHA